ncbi:phosphodiester glycosidase family protein [Streptomyces sp. NA02950]|uniref:phosphodiester glycosidase family protein n=1 Tax=Streptomyces sp. NA02950 TaxID=2742137 RepID=UPI001591A7C6|nr:phosphodiester glycosidase family protein [Streptomyces sp. NA02950]QKV96796.1 phosphodiester glycosidase family protein [Streptomyces sp. NA02950]
MPPVAFARPLAVLAAVSALVAGAAGPAAADDTRAPAPEPFARDAAEMLRPIAPPPPAAAEGEKGAADTTSVADGDGLQTARTSRPVAPGVELTSYDRLESDKWLRVDSLSVDLTAGSRVDYLHPDKVTKRLPVSELAAAHDAGPGRRTVAAINGDFFDINQTGAPEGIGIDDGHVVNSASAAGPGKAVGIGPQAAGRLLQLYFDGTLTLPDGDHPLAALNAANVPSSGIGAYNAQWGEADRAQTVDGARRTAEVAVVDGKVSRAASAPGKGAIPAGTTLLVGRDAGADELSALAVGDSVTMEYRPRAADGDLPRTAVSGRELLVVDGKPIGHEGEGNNTAAPRTAVGFSRDGRRMQIITVDGRQADSGGVTLTELGLMMKEAGSYGALNLDGGGSSTLVAREPGSDRAQVENSPSDGSERTVPNGLAFTAPDGSGRLTGFRVGTMADALDAPTVDPVRGGHPERVFPGLTRRLTAAGYDETYGPAKGAPHWRTADPGVGRVSADGTFTARRGGATTVTARRGSAHGALKLTVLDRLDRIRPTTRLLGLADAEATGRFGIVGLDAHGASAPVEPSDVHLDYDHALFTITPDPATGTFTVTARGDEVAGRVTVRAGDTSTVLAVTAGLRERQEAAFDDAGQWTFSQARASGSAEATPEGHTGTGLKLRYDFTQSTATRAAYVTPPRPIDVEGQPQSFGLWIKGDGTGAWPTLHLKDAAGSDQLLRGPYVTWTGWRHVDFTVPAGIAYPLTVNRFYLAETGPARQYTGGIVIDDLTAQVPPPVELPAEKAHPDPLISTAARTGGRDWRFAVMSDAQFVAREPNSPIVAQARRTLREIKAARPDFLVINGDLVDEGSPEDLSFARTVLTQELGDAVPWYYVPGNHEVMGGRIDNFTAEFGPAHRTFDHQGTRFITLDTSSLGLRGGGFDQIKELRAQLEAASHDRSVGSVMVIEHVPPRDPTPQQGSRLSDRKEAALLENWLADFRRTTGKGAAFIGSHVGTFHASRVDGVPYLINGNSGKYPSSSADRGGFTGWSMVGVDHVPPKEWAQARRTPWKGGPDWVSVQTRPHVDGLTVTAPAELRTGQDAAVTADVIQGEGPTARRVPVRFPVSADWSGSPNVFIGDPSHAGRRHVAAYDPVSGTLTALRPGAATLTVKVNGATAQARFTVAARAVAVASGSAA